jgi:hypothetical protein
MTVTVTITADAAINNQPPPSPVDRSADFNTFFAGPAYQKNVEINGGYNTTTLNGGFHVGKQSVLVPFGTSMFGTGQSSKFYMDAATNTPVFRLNTDNASQMVTQVEPTGTISPGFENTTFRDFYVSGDWVGNDTAYAPVFELGESATIENIRALYVQTLVSSPAFYIDQITIRKCTVGGQPAPNPVTETERLKFAVELGNTLRVGDGLVIDQLHMTNTVDSQFRSRAVRLANSRGAQITNGINGDHEFRSCTGINFSGFHGESGQIRWISSSGTSRDNTYWMRSGSQYEIEPIRVQGAEGASGISTASLHLENETFVYQTGGAFPWSTATNNISIVNLAGSLTIKDCHCSSILSGATSAPSGKAGIKTGNIVFDRYSHFASIASHLSVDQWYIEGAHGYLGSWANGAYDYPQGIQENANQISTNFGRWNLPSGNYYFRLVVYLDPQRKIGVQTKTVPAPQALVNGGGAIALALNIGRGPKYLRVYIGLAIDQYDRYIDIPWVDGDFLMCEGDRIMGYPAISRTPGGIDTVILQPARYELRPGDPANSPTPASPDKAYGNVEVWHYSASSPSAGTWNRGDIVHRMTPVGGKRGFLRATQAATM